MHNLFYQLKFTSNPNGKLFADVFGDIRLADFEKFKHGNEIEIHLNKHEMGVVEVVGYKDFSFTRLTDTMSVMNCGHGSAYQASLLRRFYDNKDRKLNDDSMLMHIVMKWKRRNMLVHDTLMAEWWKSKKEQFPYIQNQENVYT